MSMLFNSYLFVLLFLPASVILYFLLNRVSTVAGKIILIAASLLFYSMGRAEMLLILAMSMAVNYASALIMQKRNIRNRFLIVLPVIVNIALLFYFKYFSFATENIGRLLGKGFHVGSIILPLGISFYTFQQIAYVVSVSKGEIKNADLLDYLTYILFFPKLLMGPLMEPADFITQINDTSRKKPDINNIACGIRIFSFGLFKKAFIADTFAKAVSWLYSNIETLTAADCILLILFYTFEIYFDFSGYSDMATGAAGMMNIDLPINFDSPYKALSIRDFWKRWHISLTRFFTKYVYIPLGGSREGEAKTYLNTMVVFLVSGLWHGANWTFVLWGLIHGLLSCYDRFLDKLENKMPRVLRWGSTFAAVNILWLLFSADSVAQWWGILRKALSFRSLYVTRDFLYIFDIPEIRVVLNLIGIRSELSYGIYMLVFLAAAFAICLIPKNNYRMRKEKLTAITSVLAALAFIWGVLSLGAESVFVYYGF